jgi:regulator of replication initiation timing
MTAPFRDDATALEARLGQLLDEIEDLRTRLQAYEGENRDAVIAAQLGRLRADIETETIERQRLRAELRRLLGGSGSL